MKEYSSKAAGLGLGLVAALAPSAMAGDYVQQKQFGLFGAGHTTTYTHTEQTVGLVPTKAVIGYDCCNRPVYGTVLIPRQVEVVTGRCIERHVDWDKSIIAAPGNLLSALGRAMTPPARDPCERRTIQYIAPPCGCPQPAPMQRAYVPGPCDRPVPMPSPCDQPRGYAPQMQPQRTQPAPQPQGVPTPAPPRPVQDLSELPPAPTSEQVPPAPVPDTGRN